MKSGIRKALHGFALTTLFALSFTCSQAATPAWVQLYRGAGDDNQANALALDANGNVFVTGAAWNGSDYDYVTIKYSNVGVPAWTNRYQEIANGEDFAVGIAVDTNGDVFVTGYSTGSNSSSSHHDYATIKYSNAGMPLWTNRYDGPANADDQASAIAVDAGGNVLVTGISWGSGMSGDYNYSTIKYSNAGVAVWTNRYHGPVNGPDYPQAVAVSSNGTVFVTGYSAGSATGDDYATIAYSSAGARLWTNRYNGPGNDSDHANDLAVDGNGNIFVTGWSFGSGSSADYATIAYTSAGASLWTNRHNGPGNGFDSANAVALDGSGNVFVTGYSVRNVTNSDYMTIAYSGLGTSLWTNRYNGPGNGADQAGNIVVGTNGNVVVTGSSIGNGSSRDYATIAYSSAGLALWTNRYNGPANLGDFPEALALDSGGNVFVTGYSTATDGGWDYATIKYSVVDPIPLAAQKFNNQLVLSWTNATFGLQSAPAVTGLFTNVPGATSPYTNTITGARQFFRLISY